MLSSACLASFCTNPQPRGSRWAVANQGGPQCGGSLGDYRHQMLHINIGWHQLKHWVDGTICLYQGGSLRRMHISQASFNISWQVIWSQATNISRQVLNVANISRQVHVTNISSQVHDSVTNIYIQVHNVTNISSQIHNVSNISRHVWCLEYF